MDQKVTIGCLVVSLVAIMIMNVVLFMRMNYLENELNTILTKIEHIEGK